MSGQRIALDYDHPSTFDEAELVRVYRDSLANDRTMLVGLLDVWGGLSTGHRAIVWRMADALASAASWRRPVLDSHEDPGRHTARTVVVCDDDDGGRS